MTRFRRRLTGLTSAAVALISMLFVATASFAANPLVQAAPGVMTSSVMQCEQDKATCSTDCAVLCHVLVWPSPVIGNPAGHAREIYQVRQTVLVSLSVEAEDPPPR